MHRQLAPRRLDRESGVLAGAQQRVGRPRPGQHEGGARIIVLHGNGQIHHFIHGIQFRLGWIAGRMLVAMPHHRRSMPRTVHGGGTKLPFPAGRNRHHHIIRLRSTHQKPRHVHRLDRHAISLNNPQRPRRPMQVKIRRGRRIHDPESHSFARMPVKSQPGTAIDEKRVVGDIRHIHGRHF